jgi:excinuclease ABC subunit C
MTKSLLEDIPGVGPKSIERLFIRFKSVEGIRKASLELLAEELGRSRALKVQKHFEKSKS